MKREGRSYLLLGAVLSFFCLLPKSFTEKLREKAVYVGSELKEKAWKTPAGAHEKQALELENMLLLKQLEEVQEHLRSKEFLEEFQAKLEKITYDKQQCKEEEKKAFLERRQQALLKRMQPYLHEVTAKVICREPAFWNSFFWVDVGEKDNELLGETFIALNSPVVQGKALVGVVDYVGKRRSRVRLVTDASLCIAVRVARGSEQNMRLLEQLSAVTEQLGFCKEVFFSQEEQENTLNILRHLQENVQTSIHERLLAKGELRGSSEHLWRARQPILKGCGFNYDYADEEGPARDLRTGRMLDSKDASSAEILIKEGDLLVTTGMDGVFYEGLHVAVVEKVEPLEEGAVAYDLRARSVIPCLQEISFVSILPPQASSEKIL